MRKGDFNSEDRVRDGVHDRVRDGMLDGVYSRDKIEQHNREDDKWIVINGHVYDISAFCKKHPGGAEIISGYAGQDASDAWYAFHTDKPYVSKFMKALCIGSVQESVEDRGMVISTHMETPLISDWHKLRDSVERKGLFNVSIMFYVAIMAHILFFDALGWFIIYRFRSSWIPYIAAAVSLTIAQVQAGWSQHDYGHLSVFKSNRLNHWTQIFIINVIKGFSSDWWNFRHSNHHSKPNVLKKDLDITQMDTLFLPGKVLPVEYGKKKKGFMPYNHQHNYFWLVLPPFVMPLYFNYEFLYYLITRKRWTELFWTSTFFIRWQIMFYPHLGFWGAFALFLFVRFLESHWFVWTTQMSHIPMTVDYDKQDDWVTMQLKATCNVEASLFNDWFSGHLNYQIEHHLFPTMPRHNLHKAVPLVKSLCKKHGLDYQCKTLTGAFADILGSLKKSGEMWKEAYHM